MKASPLSRREFCRRAAAAAVVAGFPTVLPSSVFGKNAPSNRIAVGLIGMGLQMSGHHKALLERDNAQVLAVSDVSLTKREEARKKTESAYGDKKTSGIYAGCSAYNEYERIIERRDIDAVLIATPDNWHA